MQIYLLLGYTQYVVLSLLLFTLLRTHRILFCAVSPISISIWESVPIVGLSLLNMEWLFFA